MPAQIKPTCDNCRFGKGILCYNPRRIKGWAVQPELIYYKNGTAIAKNPYNNCLFYKPHITLQAILNDIAD